jgi:hypothetical protein
VSEQQEVAQNVTTETERDDGTNQIELLTEILPDVILAFKKLNDEGKKRLFRTIGAIF